MTGSERILQALSPEGTAVFPVVVCYEGILVRDHWAKLTSCPWWYLESPAVEHQLAWRKDFFEAITQDWFHLPLCPSHIQRQSSSIEESENAVTLVDMQSGTRRQLDPPVVGGKLIPRDTTSVAGKDIIETHEEIDRRVAPKPLDVRKLREQGRFDLGDELLAGIAADRFPVTSVHSPLWDAAGLWGFEGLMTMVATHPELVEHACERYLQHSIEQVRCAAARGVRGIWIEECFSDMVGPYSYRRLCLPYLRSLVEAIRESGLFSIFYFCGNPNALWDLLLDAKADALSFEESKKGFEIDIEDLVERVQGRCTILGNLNAVQILEQGTNLQLQAEIARQMSAGRRNANRFIMSLGSPVTPWTPMDRLKLYFSLSRSLGLS